MDKLKNTPSLRFPDFEGNWNVGKMIDYSTFYNGKAFKQEELLDNGKYPVLRVGNLFSNNNWYFSNLELEDNKYIEQNDLIYAWSATFGPRIWKGNKVIYHYHIWKVLCKTEKVNKWFFYQILDNATAKMKANSSNGFALLHITKGTIENWSINIPSLSEQTKIASFLTAVDDKLQALKQKKTLLEQYKKGVMQKIFSQELRFKDDNGNDYPDWEEKKLGEIGETYNGLTGKSKEHFGDGKPYIQYKQIFDDSKIDISRFEFVQISPTENQNKVVFGDVFFTISSETPNEIGTASVLLDDIQELYLNSFCFGYRALNLYLNPYFSRYLFRNELFRNQIIKLAQGSTRFNMSKVQLMKLTVKLPCIEEQTKIANFLSAIDDKINHCQSQLEKTEVWKKGLLQQMFC